MVRKIPEWSEVIAGAGRLIQIVRAKRSMRSKLHRGVPRPYPEARALGYIDTRIADLVEAMNVEGICETIACCEGHWCRRSKVLEIPYVWFKADITFVRKLNRLLVLNAPGGAGRLNIDWIICYGQSFDLRPHMPSDPNDLTRRQIDEDFATITAFVRDLGEAHAINRFER